jgi:glycine/D-amino acid oxidase-like deaminating enzyme
VNVRIAVIGGGIAGALLSWRLARAPNHVQVELFLMGPRRVPDATTASGGLVRGFELDPIACEQAATSLAELRSSPVLRQWSGYREVGSVILLGPDPLTGKQLDIVDSQVPGSVALEQGRVLARRYPFWALAADQTAVVERCAGYISPERLRSAVIADLPSTVVIREAMVAAVGADAVVVLANGDKLGYDTVILATGAWTPRLLGRSGLPAGSLRTKQIQYTLCPVALDGLGSFADVRTGFYGRPANDGFLLGMHCERWDIDPAGVTRDDALVGALAGEANRQFGLPPSAVHNGMTVASFDCYHPEPGLALRPVRGNVFTFTAGSGAAAKTVLAASISAAAAVRALAT